MENNLIILGLVLKELDIPTSITSVSDRLLIQKGIYLTQALGGVHLGYAYSWYVRGPYSPPLTKDYYSLEASLVRSGTEPISPLNFRDDIRAALHKVKDILQPPPQLNLSKYDWAELLASVAYLCRAEKRDEAGIKARLQETKPWLWEYTGHAVGILCASGMTITT